MKSILNGLLLFTLIYLLADVFVSSSTIGFSNLEVYTTLYGNEEEFLDPITPSAFLEYLHTQIFFMMMILLTLSAIFLRLSGANSFAILSVNSLMLSALTTLIFLALVYFMQYDALITPYIFFFVSWHLIALYMTIISLWRLNFATSI